MASRLLLLLTVFLFCVALVSSDAQVEDLPTQVDRRAVPFMECGRLCSSRCSLHSRPNRCNRACGTCCVRCKCVPPGTSGNRELCGTCYTDMTTHGNKTKCP